ncbi:MAG: DUF4838 domain-containing protein [Kiritimatiellae bacterium]|nr:DUF4838 domain-containing protein [Kiritimatiellia bacterium]
MENFNEDKWGGMENGKGRQRLATVVAAAYSLFGCALSAAMMPTPFSADDFKPENFDAACDRRFAEWQARIKDYRPDYSDSTRHLSPPEGNRFAKPFPVVKNGRPACEILLSNRDLRPCVRKAAEEFVRYVKDITGVELSVVTAYPGDRRNGLAKLCIGKGTLPIGLSPYTLPKFEKALRVLSGRDGYAIMTEDAHPDRLYVFGQLAKGTMNGVYALLENNTDIIWARPDESIGTVFTPSPGELEFVWGEGVVSVPDSRGRGWLNFHDIEWMAHNGCNMSNAGGGGDIEGMNGKKFAYGVLYTRHMGGHNIGQFLRGCDRWVDPKDGNPCFSSDRVLAIVCSNVLDVARKAGEDTDKIYINLHDTWKNCECEECRKDIVCEDGTVLKFGDEAFRSTKYWTFFNKVGRALAKEFPRMCIVSLAYFSTRVPPKCRLEPNVHPEYAPYPRLNDKAPLVSPDNRRWLRDLQGWQPLAKEIETYDYYGLGLDFPRPLAEVRAWDFSFMHPFVVGMASEVPARGDSPDKYSRALWDASAMEVWVMTKLYWDPSQDVEQLRKRYIRRTFREAAPEVERIYGNIREEWFRPERARQLSDTPLVLARQLLVDTGRDKEIERLFAAAFARADLNPKSRANLETLKGRLMPQIEEARNLRNPSLRVPLVRVKGPVGFDSPEWSAAAASDDFLQVTKERSLPSAHRTSFRVFHDTERIFLKVVCEDRNIAAMPVYPGRGDMKEEVPRADHLEFFIGDPSSDGVYYMFSLSPEGVAADLRGYDCTWNCPWDRQARRTATGWEAWIAVPFASVNAQPQHGNDLRLLVLRDYMPHGDVKCEELSSWGGGRMHQFVAFGDIRIVR